VGDVGRKRRPSSGSADEGERNWYRA